jgi:2-polyprenyl-3-methyl-5-hydroxy-6-metoxy-1,4-benzoquinol methylase
MSGSPVDVEKLNEFSKRVFGLLNGAVTSALVHLGDELGLYRALANGGLASSAELAERTGLVERWVREWLFNQAAAGLLETLPDERFALSPEAVAVLADETSPAFGAGLFGDLPRTVSIVEQLRESFRTGLGLPYDALGPEGARGVERGFAPWVRHYLIPQVIDRVPGLRERLERGARVADVGCGGGFALLHLARQFPRSELHGFELSRCALERAARNRAEAGVSNAMFHDVRHEPLPEGSDFDLILTFDCLHDMTHPQEVIASIRKAIASDGVWLIADIKAHPSFADNVAHNPMASLMYGFSVLTCMSSSLSAPGGAGLGTLGLPEELACRMAREAGFSRFRAIDADHPVNAFYEVRP